MNASMLWALLEKDITLFFKNRFYALITVLGLVVYVAIFYVLPNSVDETLELGWYGPDLPGSLMEDFRAEGLILNKYATEADLKAAVEAGDEPVGVSLPDDFIQAAAQGKKPTAVVYVESALPDEYRDAYTLLMEELGYALVGQTLNIESEEVLLGPDMAGQQVPPRQRMLPVLAIFILAMETMGMASLFTTEAETGTLRALLVTRLRLEGLFLSKGITGVLLAFLQVIILLAVTGGLRSQPLLLAAAFLLGSLLVTGISFLISSVGRDMMSVMGWGMLAMLLLAIPAFNVLLPGLASNWIKVIPSYYLVDAVYRVMNFQAGWSEVSGSLLALLAFAAAFFGIGVLAMKRRLQ